MYIKSLKIESNDTIIRTISFHKGLNLILDENPESDTETGNGVGKTTVLRLIDILLGKDKKVIYSDTENSKQVDLLVKNFLIEKEIVVELILSEDLKKDDVIIRRNFLERKNALYEINGTNYNKDDFINALEQTIFPTIHVEKPSFRQIISHNIRYEEFSLSQTLKTLNTFTTDEEYEALHLFLFDCSFDNNLRRQEILENLKIEEKFKKRLEKDRSKNAYEASLNIIENEIKNLEEKKDRLNSNPNFKSDFEELQNVKNRINILVEELNIIRLRINLIKETKTEYETQKTNTDITQVKLIYEQAGAFVDKIQKTFEELVDYHNKMIEHKIHFITKELPDYLNQKEKKQRELDSLCFQELELTKKIRKTDTFDDLDEIISELNIKYEERGKFESILAQIIEVDSNIETSQNECDNLDKDLFSPAFEQKLKAQLEKFNKYFSEISEKLYGEKYIVSYEITTKKGRKIYKFQTNSVQLSTGKKQGEISCFDIAYTLFANDNNIPHLNFLLNDKKELMHDNQLTAIANAIKNEDIQFVASILKDKIPAEWNDEEYIVVKLSHEDKLFRIENL